jgi:DNA-binding transcriptional regulator LsrR (DeoR family)
VERRIGVAGGAAKLAAIRGAVRGRWINILITDVEVARALLGRA